MVPHVFNINPHFSTHEDFSQALFTPHVDSSPLALDLLDISMAPANQGNILASILGPCDATSHHKWKKATQLQAICQLRDKAKVQSIDYPPHTLQ